MAVFDDALKVARPFLGPAADVFLKRQVTQHLQIEPTQLAPSHIPELAKWCYISGKLVMDEPKAQEFRKVIAALG